METGSDSSSLSNTREDEKVKSSTDGNQRTLSTSSRDLVISNHFLLLKE